MVDSKDSDLRWFYRRHRNKPRPGCMFAVPMEQTHIHAPWVVRDGPKLRISYMEVPEWLWHQQGLLRRQWRTLMYTQNGVELPEQMGETQ